MARVFRTILAASLLAAGRVAPAAAQFTSLPLHVSPSIDPRLHTIMVAGDLGFVRENTPGLRPLAARVVLSLGRWSVTAGAGVLHDPDIDDEFTLGGAVGYDIATMRGGRPAATVQLAAGHVRMGDESVAALDRWDVPLAVGFAWNVAALDVAVEPWIAPRAHLRIAELAPDETDTDFGFGTSAGLNLTHAVGPGLHVGTDLLWIADPFGRATRVEFVLSAGVHMRIAIP
jgi:hypothetical protein